ncbi:MAG: methyltransferase domain-containing protein [Elusimicrobia bacterium]|nr:methyltransferase domain-containing protein [Elusimicrobiota bacterium]
MSEKGTRDLSRLKAVSIGCGPVRDEDAVNVDRDPGSVADVFHDLNAMPWPFPDGRFEEVRLSHVIEHLDDPDRVVREAHRVGRAGGIVKIVTPHFSSYESYGDITHKYHFGLVTFKPYYSGARPLYRLASRTLSFGSSPLTWPGRLFAAMSFDLYEKYFAWIFPGRNMEFRLEVLK